MELIQAEDQNQAHLFTALVESMEKRQEELAAYLHADILPQIALLKMKIEVRKIKKKEAPDDLIQDMITLMEISDLLRNLMYDLHPSLLKHFGLVKSFKEHVRELAEKKEGSINLNIQADIDDSKLSKLESLHIFKLLSDTSNFLFARINCFPIIISLNTQKNELIAEFGMEKQNHVLIPDKLKKLFTSPELMSIKARLLILQANVTKDTDWINFIKFKIPFRY